MYKVPSYNTEGQTYLDVVFTHRGRGIISNFGRCGLCGDLAEYIPPIVADIAEDGSLDYGWWAHCVDGTPICEIDESEE